MRPSPRRQLALAAAMAVLALLLAWASVVLPILSTRSPGGQWTSHVRSDLLARDPTPYEAWLLHAPLAASAVALVAAGLLAFPRPPVQRVAAALGAAAGLVHAVVGARWLGFAVARSLDAGAPLAKAEALPWAELAGGGALAAVALAVLAGMGVAVTPWRAPRGHATLLAVGWLHAAALLAAPLLPLARLAVQGGWFHYDELTIAALAQDAAPAARAHLAIGVMRAAFWGGAAAGAAAWLRPVRPWDGIAAVASALAAAAALAACAWAAWALRSMPVHPSLGPNVAPPLAALAAAGLVAWGLRGRRAGAPQPAP